MLRHPRVHSCCACLVAALFALAAAQDTAFDSQKVTLQAVDVKTATIPAGAPATIMDIVVDPSISGGNTLDIISGPGVLITLIQPGNIEVTSANAASLGYEWAFFTPDPTKPVLTPLQFPGPHTLIRFPSSAPAGTYTVKANASQTTVESGMMVTYNSDSSLQAGLSSKAPTYRVGETAVLTAILFDNTTPLTGVAASAKLMAEVDASSQGAVQNVQLLSSTPAGAGRVREVYTARLLNTGPALSRAQARFRAPSTIAVIDGTLFFGEVPTGATVVALNNFTIERKTNDTFQISALQWFVEAAHDMGQITLTDSGALDAQSGDGLYTGSFVPSTPGLYFAMLHATGTSPSGGAFSRSAATEFEVITPKAAFLSFQDQSIDDDANGLADRVVISANISVSTAGPYQFLISLKASNGNTLHSLASANLSPGTAQMTTTFSAGQVIRTLGTSGPFERTDAILVYEQPDGDTLTVDFRAAAGVTPAWPLSSFDRGTLYLTGQNSATALSTDGAPLFNVLRASVGVFYAPGGYCHWSASLSAGQSASYITIERAYASGMLSPGVNNVALDFQGAHIAKTGPHSAKTVEAFHIECGEHRANAQTIAQNSIGSSQFRPGATGFTLSADPVSLTIPAGTSAYVSVAVTSPSLFTNQILSTVTGLPPGVGTDIRFPQLSSAPGSFVVHFHAQPSASPGAYQAVVTSTGGGVQQSLTIPVTITPLLGR